MWCGEGSLVNYGAGYGVAIPLRCRSWGCDECAPNRKAQLIAEVASGLPERLITLTTRRRLAETREQRAAGLARAWRVIAARIRRQLAKPAAQRWTLARRSREPAKAAEVCRRAQQDDEADRRRLDYFAIFEATKLGEPHLHLVARSPFIPQDWLSEQAAEIIDAPICDIRKVYDRRHACRYVAKYVGKAPHRFGTCKRYWHTRDWCIEDRCGDIDSPYDPEGWFKSDDTPAVKAVLWRRLGYDVSREEDGTVWYGLAPRARGHPP